MKNKATKNKLTPKKLSMAIALALSPVFVSGQLFDAVEPLENLNGNNGFRIDGAVPVDLFGKSASSAGDFNGDGIDDLIIAAPHGFDANNPGWNDGSGKTHIVFGKSSSGFAASMNVSELDGSNGFELTGISERDDSGASVSGIGDINGDGIDDVIIGAPNVQFDLPGFPPFPDPQVGEAYVVFGSTAGFSASMSLSELNGSNGFTLRGHVPNHLVGRKVGAAGDFNGDGIDDLMVAAPGFDHGPTEPDSIGAVYVLFGSTAGFTSLVSMSDINGSNGVRFIGFRPEDGVGFRIGSAGDFNGDNIDDIIIASGDGSLFGEPNAGVSYVVFGSTDAFAASMSLADLDGSNGFAINGIPLPNSDPNLGLVDGIGDINGDGFDDLIIGNRSLESRTGVSYVVFGSNSGFASTMELSDINGSNGFVIIGERKPGFFGGLFGNDGGRAGDVNGDGLDDLIVAAYNTNEGGGSSYVIFGSTGGFASPMEITDLNGNNGFALPGVRAGDRSGVSASAAGDVNNDGIDDLLIGAQTANPDNLATGTGASYVVFGRRDVIFSNNFEGL